MDQNNVGLRGICPSQCRRVVFKAEIELATDKG
jgi:hypothetical protein